MLDFLVTSKVRRRLLDLLWRRNASGSASDLARRAGVGFAGAYRELQAMQRVGLVAADRSAGGVTYCANTAHPSAGTLRSLVESVGVVLFPAEPDRIRGQLRALGAPLLEEPADVPAGPVDEIIVRGVALAHSDPGIARALPVCLFRVRDRLDPGRLGVCARRMGERHAVGFFLDLTAELAGGETFSGWSRPLRDHRRKLANDFFFGPAGSGLQRRLAEERTPDAARRWGFRMNMDLESFRTLFEKFVHAA